MTRPESKSTARMRIPLWPTSFSFQGDKSTILYLQRSTLGGGNPLREQG